MEHPTVSNPNSQDTSNLNTNVVGLRVVAFIIDSILAAGIIGVTLLLFVYAAAFGGHTSLLSQPVTYILFSGYYIYYFLMEWLLGGTIGKVAVGLRVKTEQGQKISAFQSFVRNIFRFIDYFFLILVPVGLVVALISKKHQRVGDLVAKTIVIKQ